MKSRHILYVVAALVWTVSPAHAQLGASPNADAVRQSEPTAIHAAQPSAIDRPSDAVRRPAAPLAAEMPATSKQLGEARTEMVVGGAAVVVGALIGGDGGAVLMFGGAVIGLYGLWNYLK